MDSFESRRALDGAKRSIGSELEEGCGVVKPSSAKEAVADKLLFGSASSEPPKRTTGLSNSSPLEVSGATRQQKVVIRNSYGENLVGILHDAGSQELVILCHGFRSSKASKTIVILADALVSASISVFRFDFAGNGDSEGSFQYGNYWREVEDLRAVTNFFSRQKHEVRAIVGHSKGGNVVLLYASKFHDIPMVVNVSGRFNVERGISDRLGKNFKEKMKNDGFIDVKDKMGNIVYRVTEESLMDRLSTDMHAACLSIDENCKVLTVHGSEDDVVPSEDALEFDKFIKNHRLHIIEGADHRFISHQLDLARTLMDFVLSNPAGNANV